MDIYRDIVIIGAGTAGLSAERSARRAGGETLLVDPCFSGTTCANVGCMPSKLLIAAGKAAHSVRQAYQFGVSATPCIDAKAVMHRLRRERDHFAQATRDEIAALPQGTTLRGKARFTGPNSLMLENGTSITAKAIVIATGARPAMPSDFVPLGDLALTNESLFELETLPETLAVIGAGPLGLELGQAMARLGVKVTLLDASTTLGGLTENRIAGRLNEILAREMTLVQGVRIEATRIKNKACLRWSGEISGEGLFDAVLVATGRLPALEGLDLERTGLALDPHGIPHFNRDTLRCGTSAIFIAGDVDADRPVLHEASAQGAIAGYNAAAYPDVVPCRRHVPFSIMFTDPPLAIIGRIDAATQVTGKADYSEQGRARIEARAMGLVHLYADPDDGRLRGAIVLCPAADHLGHLIAWSIEGGLTAGALLKLPFYHPVLEEGLKPALRAICKAVGHLPAAGRDEELPSCS